MSTGSNQGSDTTTTRTEPWSSQAPYLQNLYRDAEALPQQVPFPYPGVVPFAPATAAAQIAQTQRALQGSPLTAIGQNQIGATAGGDYLYGGPGFDRVLTAAHRQIAPMVRSQFERAGRYGSGLQQATEMQLLGNVFAGQYGQERDRQMRAAQMTPTMAAVDYGDISALSEVGAQQEARAREALADALSRWQMQQGAPYETIGARSQIIQGGYPGGFSTTQAPLPRTSPLANALGGGMMGYGLAQAFPAMGLSSPVGFGIGAGIGLLGGM